MPTSSFHCPFCAASLKIRDRRSLDREVRCPDCDRALRLVVDSSSEIKVVPWDTVDQRARVGKRLQEQFSGDLLKSRVQGASAKVRDSLANPIVVGWSTAGCFTLLLVFMMFSNNKKSSSTVRAEQAPVGQERLIADEEQLVEKKISAEKSNPAEQRNSPEPPNAEQPPVVADVVNPVVAVKPASEPAVAQKPKAIETIDVSALLKQPILRFEQARPVPFRELLALVEEMAGVPIRYDAKELAAVETVLDTNVTIKLHSTTVGGILKSLLQKVGLTFEIEADGIRLHVEEPDRTTS